MANKIYLSPLGRYARYGSTVLVVLLSGALSLAAQVTSPPSAAGGVDDKAAQEQVEEKPLTKPASLFSFIEMPSSAHIQFTFDPLSLIFVAEDGEKSTILFAEDGVTYSGDIPFDESTKMFFDLFWKEYVLKEHLKAKCEKK